MSSWVVRGVMRMSAGGLVLAGCAHYHLDSNAPGQVDVQRPPENLEARGVEEPSDPGEHLVVFGYGAFAAAGAAVDDETSTLGQVGLEFSVLEGEHSRSHYDDNFFIVPESGWGGSFGWTLLSSHQKALGPLYAELELQLAPLTTLGAGYSVDLDERAHGAQATLSLGPLYLRATHHWSAVTLLTLGLHLEGTTTLVWSR